MIISPLCPLALLSEVQAFFSELFFSSLFVFRLFLPFVPAHHITVVLVGLLLLRPDHFVFKTHTYRETQGREGTGTGRGVMREDRPSSDRGEE